MITKEQIEQAAQEHIKEFGVWKVQSISPGEEANAANFDFSRGAKWAAEKLQAENEKLQANVQEGAELIVKWVKAYEAERADNIRLLEENARLRELLDECRVAINKAISGVGYVDETLPDQIKDALK